MFAVVAVRWEDGVPIVSAGAACSRLTHHWAIGWYTAAALEVHSFNPLGKAAKFGPRFTRRRAKRNTEPGLPCVRSG